ncbi:MAG: addiction module toxin, HicA family [bacterium (Candidatus Ratteibacteria) CG23_combo_of_CG06-09_8_20_14_all_48_7]|uniref:Addiction module toxin, HicA family n=1 Tax=bacterium (Candidatus Ratteibacteria) CG23_combo_of_CG06-09_8_20_14_all_48_7 TaxID=2014292 RepID=A0A2G9YBS5_9BACT|nr:MAG: addiction module toxin, HicA family [bacterium (Candidatus Ratteibacteria) CG23_combo_of_CG06-09_8_20_14_all_48_7]
MKRRDLLRHLERHGCEFLREGGNHSVYVNRRTRKSSTVPRHNEIIDFLARKICKDLEIPPP